MEGFMENIVIPQKKMGKINCVLLIDIDELNIRMQNLSKIEALKY